MTTPMHPAPSPATEGLEGLKRRAQVMANHSRFQRGPGGFVHLEDSDEIDGLMGNWPDDRPAAQSKDNGSLEAHNPIFTFTTLEEVPADLQGTFARLREADDVHLGLVDHVLGLEGHDLILILSYLAMLEKQEAA